MMDFSRWALHRGAGDTPPEVYRKEWEFARSQGLPITQHTGRSLAEIKRFPH